ncbi:hypothetical protein [Ferrimonas aestuarii]|uniref:Lipoprotein n=1 Tax=Ferrimonas aestuarii TaxID=2569539 RepID=A0A4V5NW82_9GAMM|nr:hypothetical protein [Ferrimonas aestuarii]TKB55508.1 hypothetical protein FCL42_10005 [Ferrimonas aestuarii]
MRKQIAVLIAVAALAGCEDASKAIDQAQEAANAAVDGMQEKMASLDLSQLDLEQFGEAADSAEALAASLQEAVNVDFADMEALTEVQEHVANAYSCLVDATSESTADKLVNSMMATLGDEQAESLIERGIEKAKAAGQCVI